MTFKGLIPAAGSGTRMGSFSNAFPKELLPVGDIAVIEHEINQMKCADITDITIVTSPNKHGLSDYLGSGKRLGVDLVYVIQDERLGLADAIMAGAKSIGNSDFAVILGDTFIHPYNFLNELMSDHINLNAFVSIGSTNVAYTDVSRYGIIDHVDSSEYVSDQLVRGVVEKPVLDESPSNVAIAGVYIFNNDIFDHILSIDSGYNNEYQLTDAIQRVIDSDRRVIHKPISGVHFDVGTPTDLMKANAYYLDYMSGRI